MSAASTTSEGAERACPSTSWGTTAAERERAYPCDALIPEADAVLYRGVTVEAPAAHVFRWLCQLRVAPYSYDWIDNFGRRSPPLLDPNLETLIVGQEVMSIFTLVDFRRDDHLTIRTKPRSAAESLFGDVGGSYVVVASGREQTRLLVKLVVRYPRGPFGAFMARVLPWGDLVMMRRQLLNLKALAEGPA